MNTAVVKFMDIIFLPYQTNNESLFLTKGSYLLYDINPNGCVGEKQRRVWFFFFLLFHFLYLFNVFLLSVHFQNISVNGHFQKTFSSIVTTNQTLWGGKPGQL